MDDLKRYVSGPCLSSRPRTAPTQDRYRTRRRDKAQITPKFLWSLPKENTKGPCLSILVESHAPLADAVPADRAIKRQNEQPMSRIWITDRLFSLEILDRIRYESGLCELGPWRSRRSRSSSHPELFA